MTVKPLSFVEGKTILQEGTAVTSTFDVRRYSAFVPDVGAALLYSELEYPTWGTQPCGEKLCVRRGEDTRHPVEGALMLNWLYRPGRPMPVYIGPQIGVSTAKDFPGFMAGVNIRFTVARKMAVMGGRMITWYKTPGTLVDGSEIASTADLEADLELERAKSAWYFGVQYNF